MMYRVEAVIDILTMSRDEYIEEKKKNSLIKHDIIGPLYDKRKKLFTGIKISISEQLIPEFPPDEIIQPNYLKIKDFEDMKRMGYKITRQFMRRYGFFDYEINWLIIQGEKIDD